MNVLQRRDIDGAVDRVGTLGGGAVQALRLMAEIDREDASVSEVSAALHPDPLLVSRVLRIANSAFYGNSRNVGTLERAIAVLGFDTLRAIAAAACLDQTLTKAGVPRPDAAALLRHSLFVAVAAREVAVTLGSAHAADAFMGGLLHDVGCTALLVADRMGTAAPSDAAVDVPPLDVHARLSRRLLERWQLPAWLGECVGQHHDLPAAGDPQPIANAATCVRLADGLAASAGWSHPLDDAVRADDPETATRRGVEDGLLAPAVRERLQHAVLREVDALVQALGAG